MSGVLNNIGIYYFFWTWHSRNRDTPGPVCGCAGFQTGIRHFVPFLLSGIHMILMDLLSGVLSIIPAFINFFGPGILVTGTCRVRCTAVPVSKLASGILCYFYQQAYIY
jgi:hypothetical protein